MDRAKNQSDCRIRYRDRLEKNYEKYYDGQRKRIFKIYSLIFPQESEWAGILNPRI